MLLQFAIAKCAARVKRQKGNGQTLLQTIVRWFGVGAYELNNLHDITVLAKCDWRYSQREATETNDSNACELSTFETSHEEIDLNGRLGADKMLEELFYNDPQRRLKSAHRL